MNSPVKSSAKISAGRISPLAASFRAPSLPSVDWSARDHTRVELDLAKCVLVADDVLLQDRKQRLSLLRTQIDTLKISHLDLGFGLLLQRAEDEKEIPHIHPHLHAVGIALPVFWAIDEFDIRLPWHLHSVRV